MKKNIYLLIFIASTGSFTLWAQSKVNWSAVQRSKKVEAGIQVEEALYSRNELRLKQRVQYLAAPRIFLEDMKLNQALQSRTEQRTQQLINQVESLIQKSGQKRRVGELKMRLAELYYERAEAVAQRESERWSADVKKWEALSSQKKLRTKRPVLKTPRADQLRRRALTHYQRLEQESRGSDRGRSRLIDRAEVLYFLATTHMDLGSRKRSIPYFRELTQRYPQSPHTFSARLNLGDLYFENAQYKNAVPQYLRVATYKSTQADRMRSYALYKLGWSYNNLGQYDKSILAFKKTIEVASAGKIRNRAVFFREAYADLTTAYALAGKYNEGHRFFRSKNNKELLEKYELTAAQVARDRGHFKVADAFYQKLLNRDPNSSMARELYFERIDMLRRSGHYGTFSSALNDAMKRFGASSTWLKKQKMSRSNKKKSVQELVSLLRKEAKDIHKRAQQKNSLALKRAALPFYSVYFKHVPKPNVDSAKNFHEMKFYYAELLYALKKYPQAAQTYESLKKGKYAATSAYNTILAYREASKADKRYSNALVRSTESFVKAYPRDRRAADLLYASASQSFAAGQSASSVSTLETIMQRFPRSSKGVEAADRILFIHEKSGNLPAALNHTQKVLGNATLLATGGSALKSRMQLAQEKLLFKQSEAMPEKSTQDLKDKSKSFLVLSPRLGRDLKEKALNNAAVYAQRSKDPELLKQSRAALLKSFPRSEFSADLYLKRAEEALLQAKIDSALFNYDQYFKFYKKKDKRREKAHFNGFFILAHKENAVIPQQNPQNYISPVLLGKGLSFLKDFPRSKDREFVLNVLAFRKGVKDSDLKAWSKLSFLRRSEKKILSEAALVKASRIASTRSYSSVLSQNKASRSHSLLAKKSLAGMAFKVLEGEYRRYQSKVISFNPQRFVKTLEDKLKALESLEKKYLKVVSYGDGEYALNSLQRTSRLYRDLAQEIRKAPEAKEALEAYAKPLYDKGVSYIDSCLKKASELRIKGRALELCRREMSSLKLKPTLYGFQLPAPQWAPYIQMKEPLAQMSARAFKSGDLGIFLLGLKLLDQRKTSLSKNERLYLDVLSGILDWRENRLLSSERTLSNAMKKLDPNFAFIARKNLAALYLNVGSSKEVLKVLSPIKNADSDVEHMRALSYMKESQKDLALKSFQNALSKEPSNQVLKRNFSRYKGSL